MEEKEIKNEIQEVETQKTKEVQLRTQKGFLEVANQYIKVNGDIMLPPNYDVNNAIKGLYLSFLQTKDRNKRPASEVCTQESIKLAIQNYISKGLDISKSQCYLVVHGNTLTLMDSYMGKQRQAKTLAGIKINSGVIYEGEKVDIEVRDDLSKVIHHKADFTKFDTDKIVGAYACAVDINTGKIINSDIMTKKEINQSWLQGSSGGDTAKKFPVEMSRKTVVARLAKSFINTSDDSAKFNIETDVGDIEIDANKEIDKEQQKTEYEDTVVIDDTNISNQEDLQPINENAPTREILYSEYLKNKDTYKIVPNSYNTKTKKIKIYE